MKKALLILCIALVAPLGSCDISDDRVNIHFVPLQILEADLPESFILNETYDIKVTFLKPNGCTFFEGFNVNSETSLTDNTTQVRNVVAIGSELDDNTGCTQATEELEDSFRFIVIHSGPYLFKFWTGEDENGEPQFLEIEVPVSEEQAKP